ANQARLARPERRLRREGLKRLRGTEERTTRGSRPDPSRLRPHPAAHEERDAEARDRGRETNDGHLNAASRRSTDGRPGFPPADEEQRDRADDERHGDAEEDVPADDDERDQRDEQIGRASCREGGWSGDVGGVMM